MQNPALRTKESAIKSLYDSIRNFAQTDGDFPTVIPQLSLHTRSKPTEPLHCIYEMGLGVVIQGKKQLILEDTTTRYGGGETLLTTIDLPVVSHVTEASPSEPFVGMMIKIDPRMVNQLAEQVPAARAPGRIYANPMAVMALDKGLADTLTKMVMLLDEPQLIPHVAPLIQQEIILRLLVSEHGNRLRQLAVTGSPSQQISRVVAWLKQNFIRPMSMNELATMASMSPSTFRQHFRSVTGMSPLQFQKKLRLQEARQQMLNRHLDASSAAMSVGYESASQFSREYTREFGDPPLRDIKKMRMAQHL
ncbi:AraC family transcriptional regulator [Pantoea sp. B9002]|uniref:AraC family transcriptional regulator n=1 Tax=Pantoea sp. B9002 TaxID=2726979 RepID=UPI0015A17515|nr:AraC family transcriptional regulator [Pantoea sp. B9002]NWA63187.1 AraC family transcriptional regulator [Pantoea sp. B9002]